MTRWINVQEAIEILEEHYIKVSYKTVTDWLRKLEIPAVPSENRKEGWSIREEDLLQFIEKKRPGLRQILQEYHHVVRDMNHMKKQMQILLQGNNTERDQIVEGSKKEDIDFLCDMLDMMSEEISALQMQNQWMKDAYEQATEEYDLLQKRVSKLDAMIENRQQPSHIDENMIHRLDEKVFQGLLRAQFKRLFPDRIYSLKGEKGLQIYQDFCNLVFPKEDKHLGIIKKGDEYIYQRTDEKSTQVNRLYNKVIKELLEDME
ncbi:helix-turn-helix domain-containing protein [Bacillus mobilis]|uniref:helix-turn-helix domain-containing protein n=1 Tax=Bacillus mobilis TaxID=2026190 RepID=UPI0021CFAF6B|nr:DNA-binding protein [Bacillus mobilis]MCU5198220.1 DNA-binding protein [Bacillus mobilis]